MTMPPYEAFEHAGLAVRLLWEECVDENDNPRTNQDGNIGVMFCDYRGYTLGDSDAPDPRDQTLGCPDCKGSGCLDTWMVLDARAYGREVVKGGFESLAAAEAYMERHAPEDSLWQCEEEECPRCEGDGEVEVGIVEYLKREHGARVILPLFVYEHSGITMSCGGNLAKGEDNLRSAERYAMDGAGWDTSTVGVIFDTAETRAECGQEDATDEDIARQLEGEVRYYAAYLENSVFGYEVIDPERDEDGEFDPEDCEGEVLGSCWGFLCAQESDFEYLRSEAREDAEYQAEQIKREQAEAHRWACADVVTV